MNDLHGKWPHRWINPKAEARDSHIEGLGVFAKEKIMQGETVGILGGVIVPADQILEYRKLMTTVGIQIDDNFFIVPTSRKELERLGVYNHSCEPNIGFASSITLVAMRDIEPEEELVFDYAFNETVHNSFDCRCGTKSCRKKFTIDDWKIPSIQEKYGQYFSPYLKGRILKK